MLGGHAILQTELKVLCGQIPWLGCVASNRPPAGTEMQSVLIMMKLLL